MLSPISYDILHSMNGEFDLDNKFDSNDICDNNDNNINDKNIDMIKKLNEDIVNDIFDKDGNPKLDSKQYINDYQEFMFNKCMKKE